MTRINKSYRELRRLQTFDERFHYLKLGGYVGRSTFGYERYLNQILYQSSEWRRVRDEILIRDDGCDLGILGLEIFSRPIVHHINPITIEDIEEGHPCVFDFNNLITTSHDTHNAIHYCNESLLHRLPKERTKGDTTPWLIRV